MNSPMISRTLTSRPRTFWMRGRSCLSRAMLLIAMTAANSSISGVVSCIYRLLALLMAE